MAKTSRSTKTARGKRTVRNSRTAVRGPAEPDGVSLPAVPGRLRRRAVAAGEPRAVESARVLVQLLLPTSGAAGADGPTPLALTRRELADRFNGLTAYLRSPAKGWWTAPDGRTEQDDVVMVEVVTETFDQVWWRSYAATLAARFGQESIHVRAIPVDMLDEGRQ